MENRHRAVLISIYGQKQTGLGLSSGERLLVSGVAWVSSWVSAVQDRGLKKFLPFYTQAPLYLEFLYVFEVAIVFLKGVGCRHRYLAYVLAMTGGQSTLLVTDNAIRRLKNLLLPLQKHIRSTDIMSGDLLVVFSGRKWCPDRIGRCHFTSACPRISEHRRSSKLGHRITTTRCPIRLSAKGFPAGPLKVIWVAQVNDRTVCSQDWLQDYTPLR